MSLGCAALAELTLAEIGSGGSGGGSGFTFPGSPWFGRGLGRRHGERKLPKLRHLRNRWSAEQEAHDDKLSLQELREKWAAQQEVEDRFFGREPPFVRPPDEPERPAKRRSPSPEPLRQAFKPSTRPVSKAIASVLAPAYREAKLDYKKEAERALQEMQDKIRTVKLAKYEPRALEQVKRIKGQVKALFQWKRRSASSRPLGRLTRLRPRPPE